MQIGLLSLHDFAVFARCILKGNSEEVNNMIILLEATRKAEIDEYIRTAPKITYLGHPLSYQEKRKLVRVRRGKERE